MINAKDVAPTEEEILSAVLVERMAQVVQWGGPDHDDSHALKDWASYISKQTFSIRQMASFSLANSEEFEHRMIKVAALAFAAIQSNRRRLHKHGLA